MTTPSLKLDPYACIDEVPLHRVRGNQLGILLSVIAAIAAQQYWILLLPLAVQLVGRAYGVRYNLFVRALSPLLPASAKTESRELLRFNNLLAILFLAVALLGFALGIETLAYVSLGMLAAAVVLALSGFCLGCFMYFQWKQFLARRRLRKS
ncbi:DUF4395 domain-containing protein [Paenibacillus sp. MWE-103]|uniref:DUF4395 domain-containing protein n=1 Tax=Paenibacillus artemisiicola TaxID=1172618 RepID=A0ABS3WKT7_9BACL|nr:DUF4395 domain-containing protein [Paenibacillus artemisiicola]MBO7748944.1 DUF4395 domain-containing protein [Paenibacillus artemisiicola]